MSRPRARAPKTAQKAPEVSPADTWRARALAAERLVFELEAQKKSWREGQTLAEARIEILERAAAKTSYRLKLFEKAVRRYLTAEKAWLTTHYRTILEKLVAEE